MMQDPKNEAQSEMLEQLLKDGLLDVEILSVIGRAWLKPHRLNEPDGVFHLADEARWLGWELVAVLLVFCFEPAAADAQRRAAAAKDIQTCAHLGQQRRVAISNG
jgi:hypothetical protein